MASPVSVHSRSVKSCEPETTPTSGCRARHRTESAWPVHVAVHTPPSQCLMDLSEDPVSTAPVGSASTASTEPSCPERTCRHLLSRHTRATESTPALTKSPFAATVRSITCCSWPARSATMAPDGGENSNTRLSRDPEAIPPDSSPGTNPGGTQATAVAKWVCPVPVIVTVNPNGSPCCSCQSATVLSRDAVASWSSPQAHTARTSS
mmetsp:Transcript_11665/g.22137  ORF Transcript_11665/g.22137 Transcript_11665/m.22137 type:complete len:207 (-) Transcript_11665:131-751(-)